MNDETQKNMSVAERKAEAKRLADQRRLERKNRKRKCALCGTVEDEKVPFIAHPDGIGPTCKEPSFCEHYRAAAKPPR